MDKPTASFNEPLYAPAKKLPQLTTSSTNLRLPVQNSDCTTRAITYWHDFSRASLLTLLQKSSYPAAQIPHFLALWSHIVPHLEPASYKSRLSRDGTPYDMQWSLGSSPNSVLESTVRIAFDTGLQPREFMNSLVPLGFLAPEEASTQLLDLVIETLDSIIKPDERDHTPWYASGIDMLRTRQLLYKIYLRPATASARSLSHARSNAIISAWDNSLFNGGLRQAYSVIEKYNEELPEEQQQKVHMLGWDCVRPEKSRVKVYTYHSHTSLRALKDMWTQRGQLTGPEIDLGLECIEELWNLLYVPGEAEWGEDKERLSRLGVPQSICLGLEIKPGAELPTPKLYLQPARFGNMSDSEIAAALKGWFGWRGFGGLSESWGKSFGEIFPHRDHTLEAGCHSFMSLAVKKGGKVSITLYLQPMIYKTLEQTREGDLDKRSDGE